MNEVQLTVSGWPPAKNEAKSMLAAGHMYADRVLSLLRATRDVVGQESMPVFGKSSLALELVVESPQEPPSDATNYLGGVGDVLEDKAHRGQLEHLADLASVSLYANDCQIHEVHYRWEQADRTRYIVRVWRR